MAWGNDSIIPTAVAAHTASQDHAGTQTTFLALIAAAIATASSSGLFTATVAEGSAGSADIQYAIDTLRNSGFGVTLSVANMILTW